MGKHRLKHGKKTSGEGGLIDRLDALDLQVTRKIFEWVNTNKVTKSIPYFLGLLPYEIYVLPGMFIAMIAMVYNNSFHPAQFHLLPHWFAFSLVTYIKHNVKRMRPGCVLDDMGYNMATNHCEGSTMHQSFPSGHVLICSALATSLTMYLNDSTYSDQDKQWLGIPFYKPMVKRTVQAISYLVVAMVGLHRIGFGYHHFGDVIIGGILGSMVGYTSYKIFNRARAVVQQEDKKETSEAADLYRRSTQAVIIGISVWAIYDFFFNKFHKLTELKH